MNLNYRTGKVNVFGNYSYNYNGGKQNLDLNRNFRNQETGELESIFSQHTDMSPVNQTHNYKVGLDYYLSKKTTLGVVLKGYTNPSTFNSTNTTNILNAQSQLQSVTLSNSLSNDKWNFI